MGFYAYIVLGIQERRKDKNVDDFIVDYVKSKC